MSKLEKIVLFMLTIIVLGTNLVYQQSKIDKLETKVYLLSEHIDRNSRLQLLLNDAYQIATSNELRISGHLVEIADMMKNHMADTSIHQKIITSPWIGTNNWWINSTNGWWLNSNDFIVLPYNTYTGVNQ